MRTGCGMTRRRQAFTLLEISIVLFLIATLVALAMPRYIHARRSSTARTCDNSLRLIQGAKERYAFDFSAAADFEPSEDDLAPYFRGESFPVCPAMGTPYIIGTINEFARCQNPDHRFLGEQPPP